MGAAVGEGGPPGERAVEVAERVLGRLRPRAAGAPAAGRWRVTAERVPGTRRAGGAAGPCGRRARAVRAAVRAGTGRAGSRTGPRSGREPEAAGAKIPGISVDADAAAGRAGAAGAAASIWNSTCAASDQLVPRGGGHQWLQRRELGQAGGGEVAQVARSRPRSPCRGVVGEQQVGGLGGLVG